MTDKKAKTPPIKRKTKQDANTGVQATQSPAEGAGRREQHEAKAAPQPPADVPRVSNKPGPKPKPDAKPRRPSGNPRGRPRGSRKQPINPVRAKQETREAPVGSSVRDSRYRAHVVDWGQVELDYVQGLMVDGKRMFPHCTNLAEDYDINVSTVHTRAKQGGWASKRQAFQEELKRKMYEITAERIAQIYSNSLDVMEAFVNLVRAKLGNQEKDFELSLEALARAHPEEAAQLLTLAERATQNIRTMLGQPIAITEQRVTNNTTSKVEANVDVARAEVKAPEMVVALAAAMQAVSRAKPSSSADRSTTEASE